MNINSTERTTLLSPSKSINGDETPSTIPTDDGFKVSHRNIKVVALVSMTYFCVSGGPYGKAHTHTHVKSDL
jgi:hypothetical protein